MTAENTRKFIKDMIIPIETNFKKKEERKAMSLYTELTGNHWNHNLDGAIAMALEPYGFEMDGFTDYPNDPLVVILEMNTLGEQSYWEVLQERRVTAVKRHTKQYDRRTYDVTIELSNGYDICFSTNDIRKGRNPKVFVHGGKCINQTPMLKYFEWECDDLLYYVSHCKAGSHTKSRKELCA